MSTPEKAPGFSRGEHVTTINTALSIIGGLGMAALLIGFWSVASSLIMYCLFVNRYTEVVFWGGLFVVWVVYENRHLFKPKRAAT